MEPTFTQSQLEAIALALGDTEEGLTGPEIGHLLPTAQITDVEPRWTKWKRLYNAFAKNQNDLGHRKNILAFIRFSLKPERYVRTPERFELLRANVNRALLFAGIEVGDDGEVYRSAQVRTLGEAEQRANDFRSDLDRRGAHPDVLIYCRAELLADNYFHAVLEATKSIADKLREITGLPDDGAMLVDKALSGDDPLLGINPLNDETEKSEQRGFATLVKGAFGMFRNPTAHAPRIRWRMEKADAEDLLSLASLIHRRLDQARLRKEKFNDLSSGR